MAQLVHLSVKKALHPEDINLQDQQLEVQNAAADVSVLLEDREPAGAADSAGKPAAQSSSGVKQRKQPTLVAA